MNSEHKHKAEASHPPAAEPHKTPKKPAGRRQAKRADLTRRLIDAAHNLIEQNGLDGLRARDIALQAKCALGALYNVFDDLDMLVLHVNSRTLGRLGQSLGHAATVKADPGDKLVALAITYLDFAVKNKNLWSALFDHRMPEGVPVPDWHLAEHSVLFEQITLPLAQLQPDFDPDQISSTARALFAAVHGIVALSLQERFVAVPPDRLSAQLEQFVLAQIRGMEQ